MDPISIGLGVVGFGLQTFGSFSAASSARESARISRDIAGNEQAINEQKRTAMELSARRQQLEIYRNTQRLRAQAQQAGVNQGAYFGSGMAGGNAQVQNQGYFNLQGVSQNLELGRNIFGLNDRISASKMELAEVQGEAATAAGLASLGGSLVKAGPMIGAMGRGFSFGGSSGNYSGTPGASNTGGLY
jgi:hypothetical protein